MANAAPSITLCLRSCRGGAAFRTLAGTPFIAGRALSTSGARWRADRESAEEVPSPYDSWVEKHGEMQGRAGREMSLDEALMEGMTREERAEFKRNMPTEEAKRPLMKLLSEIKRDTARSRMPVRKKMGAFWNDEEPDPDAITDEINEDEFEENDITSMAHGKLEEHRDHRHYARVTAWEMPLLSSGYYIES